MKKIDKQNLVAYLRGDTSVDITNALQALEEELEKDKKAKSAKAQGYSELWDIIYRHMDEAPKTVNDIYESCKDELPEGITKNKIQYGLNNYWTDVVVRVKENPNVPYSYRLNI